MQIETPAEFDMYPGGAGLTLMPSGLWTGRAMVTRHPDGSAVVVYPAATPLPLIDEDGGDPLAELLGRTRAAMLSLTLTQHTTTELAREIGVSAAAVPAHTKALRAAGLIVIAAPASVAYCHGGAAAELAFVKPQAGKAGGHADDRYQHQKLPLERAQHEQADRRPGGQETPEPPAGQRRGHEGRQQQDSGLPSVKEVVDALSVNPNTVVKAFSELEHQGMVVRRQGVGTFVAAAPPLASLLAAPRLLGPLARWVERARQEGLSAEQIRMLLEVALDEPATSQDDRHAAGGAG